METYNITALKTEDLLSRAKRVNYKNKIPKEPLTPTTSTMRGYYKRLTNWYKQLAILEKERIEEVKNVRKSVNLLANYVSA